MITGSGDTHTQESEAGRSGVQGKPWLQRKIQVAWVTITTTIKINDKVRSNKTDISTYG